MGIYNSISFVGSKVTLVRSLSARVMQSLVLFFLVVVFVVLVARSYSSLLDAGLSPKRSAND